MSFVAVLIDTVAATEYAVKQLPHAVPEPRLGNSVLTFV